MALTIKPLDLEGELRIPFASDAEEPRAMMVCRKLRRSEMLAQMSAIGDGTEIGLDHVAAYRVLATVMTALENVQGEDGEPVKVPGSFAARLDLIESFPIADIANACREIVQGSGLTPEQGEQ